MQDFHEVSRTMAVQSLQFRNEEETVPRILPVTEVLHPIHPATAVIIDVARSFTVSIQWVQEIPAHPPLNGKVMTEHLQPVTRFCQYLLFSYHTTCFYVRAKNVPRSSDPPVCQAFPASNVRGIAPRQCGGSVSFSHKWSKR